MSTASESPKPAKTRSPAYPVISLGEAITRIRIIFEKQRMYPANREVIAKILGYGSLSGTSATVISALSKYGLLEGHGDTLKVSALGQDLALHRPGDPEYTAAIEQAALMPTLFRDLQDQYPDGLPHEHALRVSLIKKGFNPKSVDSVMRVYRDTLELVRDETGGLATQPLDEATREVPMQVQPAGPSRLLAGAGIAMGGATTVPANASLLRTIQLPYSVTEWATLQAAFPLSEDAWKQMLDVLNAMKPALVTPSEKKESQAAAPSEQSGEEPFTAE